MEKRSGKFAGDDPFEIAQLWLHEAEASEINDPNAIALSTVDADGLPNVRMVLLKGIEREAFVFYTNYESAKAREIDAAGKAAFVTEEMVKADRPELGAAKIVGSGGRAHGSSISPHSMAQPQMFSSME